MKKLYIGIDGGGTHSTAVAVWPEGTIAARANGGGLNYLNDGLDKCLDRFRALIIDLTSGLEAEQWIVCAGLAALDGPASPDILSAFQAVLPKNAVLILESDLTVALTGHTLGEPGMMAVCGTGSMLLALDKKGQEHTAGGWGWKIGDPGSGYALAREGLAKALHIFDADDWQIPLLTAALSFFSVDSPRRLIDPLYAPDAGPDSLATFGAEVIRLAEGNDPDALDILSRQMDGLSAAAAGLLKISPEALARVGLFGGVFQHSALARSLFSNALQNRCPDAKISLLSRSPALGAVILAMLRQGAGKAHIPAFTEDKP